MRKEPKSEVDPAQELEEILRRIEKPIEKEAAQKFSKVTRDESGSKTLHIAEPATDKDRNEITPDDYVIK